MVKPQQKRRPLPWWIPIFTAITAGIILFFLLAALEPARHKLLGWIGIKQPIVKGELPASDKPSLPAPSIEPVAENPVIDPGQINSTIQATPILQRSEAVKHYVGIKVDWAGKLIGLDKKPNGLIKISVGWRERIFLCFEFEVDPADYPGIGLLKADDPIRVRGTIKEVVLPYPILLNDVTLVEYGILKK
jgi:hypothetical protein